MTDPADLVALRALVDAYALAVDVRDADGFRDLWTPDARLTVHDGDAPPTSAYEGVDAIVGVIDAIGRYRQTVHVVGAHRVTVDADDADAATGEVTCVAHHLAGPDPARHDLVMFIRYVDRYRRGDGAWRFESRECRKRFTVRQPVETEWEAAR